MNYFTSGLITILIVGITWSTGYSQDVQPATTEDSVTVDVCDRTSHDWSIMRGVLITLSLYPGSIDTNVQRIVREALAESEDHFIGEFELQFARGHSGLPPPDDWICYTRNATFMAISNDNFETEAVFNCVAILNEKGEVVSITCELSAG